MCPTNGSPRDRGAVWIPAAVFLAALALRLVCLVQLHAGGLWDYLRLDPLYYHDWAVKISQGDILGSGTFEMSPLYAYLLGGLFKLAGYGLWAPRLAQAAIGAGTCALIAFLGTRIFGRAEGLVGGLLLAAYGPDIFHGLQITKTVLTTGLSTAAAAILFFSEGRRAGRIFLGGLALGVTALCQENILAATPILLVWILRRAPKRSKILCAAALVCGVVCAVAPATLRNFAVAKEFVLITSGGGEVFYTGNNEFASGKYRVPSFVRPDPFFEHEDFRAEAARRTGRQLTRRESDAFWWREGVRFIKENPRRYAALLWDKLATYLNDFERPDNYSYQNFARFVPVLSLPLARFGWIVPFALLGLIVSAPRWETLLPLHLTMGVYLLSALLFFTQSRYRMPMVPLLILFSARGLVWLAGVIRQRRWASIAW
ncbi:MAG TPA: glycosyltransferase family 39 protein, partial [Candidatus Polarisedimenticolia bacterium]|nr:glycosyltransferase family 39 protein [Candidatus Polarisedimenticolia bacterium]